MTEQEQAAAKDPRVGDKWTTPDGYRTSIMDVVKVDGGWITFRAYGGVSKLDGEHFMKFVERWTLAARGPAPAENLQGWLDRADKLSPEARERDPKQDPLVGDRFRCNQFFSEEVIDVSDTSVVVEVTYCDQKSKETIRREDWPDHVKHDVVEYVAPDEPTPERDPATTPVVGDEWLREDGAKYKVVSLREKGVNTAVTLKNGAKTDYDWGIGHWPRVTQLWRLHRRGDDPAWRPEVERSEQPAAGIKVGDRVRRANGDEGVVSEILNNEVWVNWGKNYRTWMPLGSWQSAWTIVPPAADPDQDDTEQPEPIEAIDRNPHTEPLVGDEWEAGLDNTNRVVALSPIQVCCLWVQTDEFFILGRDDFAAESMLWRLSKAADLDPDETGDEPPTPAFEGDPSKERFTTYQPDPVEERFHRDSKYIRRIFSRSGNESIDVDIYNVLDAYKSGCPAIDHAVKKLLCAGIRGSKSRMQDLRESRDSIMRAMEMQHQRETKGNQ